MTDFAIDNDWSPKDRREYERHSVAFYLRVINMENGCELGHLVDISVSGMKLVSNILVPVNTTFHVRLDIALGSDYQDEVQFETQCVWSQADDNPGQYESGFRNTLPPEAMVGVQKLINVLVSME